MAKKSFVGAATLLLSGLVASGAGPAIAQDHHNPVGRTPGREWAVPLATSGHFRWPPMGNSYWPLTVRTRSTVSNATSTTSVNSRR